MVVLNLGIGIRFSCLCVLFAQILIKNYKAVFCNYIRVYVSEVICAALVRPEARVKQMNLLLLP
jgi:hypothetical protein